MRFPVTLAALALTALGFAQSITVRTIHTLGAAATMHPGSNHFMVDVRDSKGVSVTGATLTVHLAMRDMDMHGDGGTLKETNPGVYEGDIDLSMAGKWSAVVTVSRAGQKDVVATINFMVTGEEQHEHHMHEGMEGHEHMHHMAGRLGAWSMSKEGSGTSWLPEASPMFMKMLPSAGRYQFHAMGSFSYDYNTTTPPRGTSGFFSNSMMMLMAHRETGGGTLGFDAMFSLDAVFNGERGYGNLFQTGETAHGVPLVDRQHPHDLVSELAASYSHPIAEGVRGFVYAGPVGEPALGGPMFLHRPSGMEIPEAPISHHWFDSTHISWGVATLGFNTAQWQLEGSAFNGHEPNENRYAPDPIQINSGSGRVTFNPSRNWSLSGSYGYLNSPESTAPGIGQHRITASALWSRPLGEGKDLATTLAWGRRIQAGQTSNALLGEATLYDGDWSIYGRWEHVQEDELTGIPTGSYLVNKFLIGGTKDFASYQGLQAGFGMYFGAYVFPQALKAYYGSSPLTFGVYFRIRPSRH